MPSTPTEKPYWGKHRYINDCIPRGDLRIPKGTVQANATGVRRSVSMETCEHGEVCGDSGRGRAEKIL